MNRKLRTATTIMRRKFHLNGILSRENLLKTAQINARYMNHIKAKIGYTLENINCEGCGGGRDDTINLIINECSKLAWKNYCSRHDWVNKLIGRHVREAKEGETAAVIILLACHPRTICHSFSGPRSGKTPTHPQYRSFLSPLSLVGVWSVVCQLPWRFRMYFLSTRQPTKNSARYWSQTIISNGICIDKNLS